MNRFLNFLIILFFFLIILLFPDNNITAQSKSDSLSLNSLNKNITITAVGDIMFGTNFPSKKYLPKKLSLQLVHF